MKFESRSDPAIIDTFKGMLAELDMVSEGRYFSQKNMEAGWEHAFRSKVERLHKAATGRKARVDMIEGLRFSQARAIRVMFNHYKRGLGHSQASAEDEEAITDDLLKEVLTKYQCARDVDQASTWDDVVIIQQTRQKS